MAKTDKKGLYTVAIPFVDAPEYIVDEKKSYEAGEDVSHFDETRLTNLIDRQIVTKGE